MTILSKPIALVGPMGCGKSTIGKMLSQELGIDFVHFGVVAVVNCMIGLITPPYGVLLFVINAVSRIPLGEIIKEVIPFLFVLIIALFMMVSIPDLVLWLPRQFGYEG